MLELLLYQNGIKQAYIDLVPYQSIYNALNTFLSESTVIFEKVEYINVGYIALLIVVAYAVFSKVKV